MQQPGRPLVMVRPPEESRPYENVGNKGGRKEECQSGNEQNSKTSRERDLNNKGGA